MATLTYDPTPADQPEFNEAEQEALAIGERQAQEEEQVYAGKFKDAEALEQAYIELQKKLGSTEEEAEAEPEVEEEELEPAQAFLNDASDEYYRDGQLSAETMEQLTTMDSKDLIAYYMETQGQAPEAPEVSQTEVNSVYTAAGGEQQYKSLMEWAGTNLPDASVEAYNRTVDTGDIGSIQLALAGLRAAYEGANGVDGELLTGKAAVETTNSFRSQAEVVEAMTDPRYDKDPAYRQDVFNKLNRSNIDY